MTRARLGPLKCSEVAYVESDNQVQDRIPRQVMKAQIVMKQLKEVGSGN